LSAPVPSRTRPLPLSVWWARSVSADRPFAYAPSLAHGPHLSATSPSLTSNPRTPSWTRPRRTFLGHSPTRPTSFGALTHSPHSPRLTSIKPYLIPAVRWRSGLSDSPPLPRPGAEPDQSVRLAPRSLTPLAHLSARARVRGRSLARI
jgi:hypothetical protein